MILVLNAGSSSLRFALFEGERIAGGTIDRIPPGGQQGALGRVLDSLEPHGGVAGIAAVGHRLVHGGSSFTGPTILDDRALAELHRLAQLDPDHLPAEIALVEALRARAPATPQVGCFDTAFHAGIPRVARLLAIPRRFDAQGVRRYGFHGLSYQFVVEELGRVAAGAAQGRVVIAHLGSGSSLAAVRAGQCVDTTMGFTPNSGVPMGTRSGDLDAGLLIYLLRAEKLTADELDAMLSKESGLLGVSGTSADMRDLLAREATDGAAADAVGLYCHHVRKAIGALATTLDGLDMLVFAGGIGENAAVVRSRICEGLGHLGVRLDSERNGASAPVVSTDLSPVMVRVVRTDEERIIARDTLAVLNRR
jgi:acetate kinase